MVLLNANEEVPALWRAVDLITGWHGELKAGVLLTGCDPTGKAMVSPGIRRRTCGLGWTTTRGAGDATTCRVLRTAAGLATAGVGAAGSAGRRRGAAG